MRRKLAVKKAIFLTLGIFTLAAMPCFSENKSIDYYGVFSPDADKNMVKMTEDLFYAQLSEMNLSLKDRRTIGGNTGLSASDIDFSDAENNGMSFYVEIKRKGDALSKWNCTIFLKNNSTNLTASFNREYDSYYKILMESKTSLKGIFQSLLASNQTPSDENTSSKSFNQDKTVELKYEGINDKGSPKIAENVEHSKGSAPLNHPVSNPVAGKAGYSTLQGSGQTEIISGTWQGEEFIDKIVIMKGGRGFIILKNGSSMNVSVSAISENSEEKTEAFFLIKQTSHSNASYFPEIPRSKALEKAVSAEPIEYRLTLSGMDVLTGTKTTLIEESSKEIVRGELPVTWKKLN